MSDSRPDPRRWAPATKRNRNAILAVLREALPAAGAVLEVGSGTGEHAAFMTPSLPEGIVWQPTDVDAWALPGIDAHAAMARTGRIAAAIRLDAAAPLWPVTRADAVFAANLLHIAPFRVAEGLFAGAGRILSRRGPLVLYGPFKRHGEHTAESNAAFDQQLRAQDPEWGVRCLDSELEPLAAEAGLVREIVVPMPANNFTVIWRRA
jgi:SAM-dependent methyltransferase